MKDKIKIVIYIDDRKHVIEAKKGDTAKMVQNQIDLLMKEVKKRLHIELDMPGGQMMAGDYLGVGRSMAP